MGIFAAVFLGGRDWLPPALAGLAVAVGLLVFAYWRTTTDSRTRLLAGLLKGVGFALLVLCLLEPLWSTARAKPGENLFLIVADNSASLTIQSEGNESRGDRQRELLVADEAPWQVRLAQDFDVRRYLFDARLQNVSGFDDLDYSGAASAYNQSLRTLAQRYDTQPLAGILLFTDGNDTDSPLTAEQLAELPPVYPIVPPAEVPPPDLSITKMEVSETIFEDAPVTVQAEVAAVGDFDSDVTCQLLDEEGRLVEEQTQSPDPDGPLTFRFRARPKKPGLLFYSVRTAPAGDVEGTFAEEVDSIEATTANNIRRVAVNREGKPFRVLYVAGRPNWEGKFLRRGVADDPQIDLVYPLRVARREAKFDFRGRVDESSNPLFRGFKKEEDAETEAYDQPVILKLGVRDESELFGGFPKEKPELYAYDAIILDDVEAAFFTHDQLSLIERFVAERGGGLMMLGGVDTFRNGKYARTPVADALPVYLDRPPTEPRSEEGYRFQLTREGWLQPWMRLRDNEADERARIAQMPPFRTVSRVQSVKPAASVLATVTADGRRRYPAVITQRYGRGRVLALMIGDLWRWGLHRPPDGEHDLPKAWRQTVRWLVADVPGRLEGAVKRESVGTHTTMRIALRVRDKAYAAQDNANLKVTVHAPDGSSIDVPTEPSADEAGLFEATYTPRLPGAYRAEATQTDDSGEMRSTTLGWTSDPAAEEFRRISIDRDRMQQLAEATGGEVVDVDRLDEFVATLPSRKVPIMETWMTPLWHRSWMFLLVLLCLIGEWGVRRVRGLP